MYAAPMDICILPLSWRYLMAYVFAPPEQCATWITS